VLSGLTPRTFHPAKDLVNGNVHMMRVMQSDLLEKGENKWL
jgi:hypothetical protein